jgi:hypothetical protein
LNDYRLARLLIELLNPKKHRLKHGRGTLAGQRTQFYQSAKELAYACA